MPRIIPIDNLALPELEPYASTSEVRLRRYYEPQPGIFVAESGKVIGRALDAGYEPLSLLVETRQIGEGARGLLERCGDIPVYTAEMEVLGKITGYHLTSGILCVMRRRELPDLASVCANASRLAVLENITNPTNVGAIFRSAAALGFDGVLLTAASSDPLYRRAIRVSMGTVFQIPWTFLDRRISPGREDEWSDGKAIGRSDEQSDGKSVWQSGGQSDEKSVGQSGEQFDKPSLGRGNSGDAEERESAVHAAHTVHTTFAAHTACVAARAAHATLGDAGHVAALRKLGFASVAMALREDSVPLDDPRLAQEEKLVVFLGNEEEGLKDATIRACDYTVRIPMARGVDSLNAAAASAVAFWQLGRRQE